MARTVRQRAGAASPSAGPPQAGLDPLGGSVAVLRDGGADIESRVLDDHHQAIKLWLRMLACTTRIENVIRQRLRSEFGTTLPRFDLLAQLDREPEGLSMGELSARMMVTGGNVTGIVDQLEGEGLVVREDHPSDRRAFRVRLTPAGRRQFRRMATVHEAWIVELFDGWSATQKTQVHGLLATLKQHLAAAETPPAPRSKRQEHA